MSQGEVVVQHSWVVGEVAFKPAIGLVGRVVGFGRIEVGNEATPLTLKLAGGDEVIAQGCEPADAALLAFHDGCIVALRDTMERLARAGVVAGLRPEAVLMVLAGVSARQASALNG